MSRSKQAFTLIELLVVIAIIAILAAILFPVFAQARDKARQTSCVSNHKQLGTAFIMYSQDYDECFPLGTGYDLGATPPGWMWNFNTQVPPDWRVGTQNTFRDFGARIHWANSTQPYIKNYQVLKCPSGIELLQPGVVYSTPNRAPQPVGYSFNGLLSTYSQAGINTPAGLPLVWEAHGKTNKLGFALTQPALNCSVSTTNPACVYTPRAGGVCAAVNGGTSAWFGINHTMWIHSSGATFTFADGHAKWQRLGAGISNPPASNNAPTNPNVDPYTGYDAQGKPVFAWTDGCHLWRFRPDATFN